MHGPGLEQLTERERRILRLLASGHSVKSAAADQEISEHAAHELLRSARRKLGTGSSREAARKLADHEGAAPLKIRDEETGLPPGADEAAIPRLSSRGVIVMSLTALAATALIAAAVRSDGPAGDPRAANAAPANGVAGAAAAAAPLSESSQPGSPVPRIVTMVPAPGAVIAPGPFEVAVTFDRPMAPDSYAFSRSDEGAHPQCSGKARLSADARTYSMACVAEAGARYVMHLNREPYIGFLDAETGTPAQEARLEFTVSGDGGLPVEEPKVVRTVPADGDTIAAGTFTVSVTFDRSMLPDHYAFVRTDEGAYPECAGTPQQSADGRTFTLACTATEPGSYVMYFNRPPYLAFRDAASRTPAAPRRLQFTVRAP